MGDKIGKMALSSKFVNALITDSTGNIRVVYVKHEIGGHFFAAIDKQVYCFRLGEIKTFKETWTKTYRIVYYDIAHYMPISANNEELKLTIIKNKLPKIDRPLFVGLQELARREKSKDGKTLIDGSHRLLDAFNEIGKDPKQQNKKYQEAIKEIKDYLLSLNIDEIVTPLSRVTDHIYNDLIATSPGFLGSVFNQILATQTVTNQVMNKPEKGAKSFIVLLLIIGLVITIGTTIYFAYDAGVFDNLGSLGGLDQFTGAQGYDQDSLMKRYPSGESLRDAVDAGQLDYNKLPKTVQEMVDIARQPKG